MEYLVLGPASMGIFAILGALTKHKDALASVKVYSGSSAGAILAVALALDIPLSDILDRLLALDIENLTRFTLTCFLTSYGLVDMGPIRQALVACYGGGDPTFADLKKKVYISAYCLNRARTEYFSVDTHPNMKVVDAVCMSMAIPFLFSSVTHEGRVYIDGCTKESVPLTPLVGARPEKIMCVRLKQRDHYFDEITNLKQFMHAMLTSAVQVPDTHTIRPGRVIEIDTGQLDLYDFTMSHEDKLRMFLVGA